MLPLPSLLDGADGQFVGAARICGVDRSAIPDVPHPRRHAACEGMGFGLGLPVRLFDNGGNPNP